MSKAARRLGRGLNSLVSDLTHDPPPTVAVVDAPTTVLAPERRVKELSGPKALDVPILSLTANKMQPRREISSATVLSLADSISHSGILQPIVVRPRGDGYEIIAGERRWAAAKAAGLATVPVLVRDATDEQMLELALIENIQREDLNAIDRALAYRQFRTRFRLTAEEVAGRLGEDRTTVVNYIRLLDLPEAVQALVADGKLGMGHARCLLGVRDDERRVAMAEAAVRDQLSVRHLEGMARREKAGAGDDEPARSREANLRGLHIQDMERRFEDAVKCKVRIHEGKRRGAGRVTIEYYSLDDFDRIASLLGVVLE